ncbi:MAG: NAD-dependent epimerase/dehydratase family protein [Halodesulfurarchaeum sp.]
MNHALVIGGTRFIGRHLVRELLDHDFELTIFNRGRHENPFAGENRVEHVVGDRTDEARVQTVADMVDPDYVFDVVAYHPHEVAHATRVFEGVQAYVYVSSGAAYAAEEIPKREDETPLEPCSSEQATDDSSETYGNRKAAGDREVARAAERGVNAMSVRPPVVYGPHDYTERLDFWLHRVASSDRIVVPGDGTNLWQRAYVEDVASGMRRVAERGDPGEWYNVGDRNAVTLDRMLELAADALGTDVELVHASDRELSIADLDSTAFPLYRGYPHLLATDKLAALGWESTPVEMAMERTVADHQESDRDGLEKGPDRAGEERLLEVLETVR